MYAPTCACRPQVRACPADAGVAEAERGWKWGGRELAWPRAPASNKLVISPRLCGGRQRTSHQLSATATRASELLPSLSCWNGNRKKPPTAEPAHFPLQAARRPIRTVSTRPLLPSASTWQILFTCHCSFVIPTRSYADCLLRRVIHYSRGIESSAVIQLIKLKKNVQYLMITWHESFRK